jgi:hypothetical protein
MKTRVTLPSSHPPVEIEAVFPLWHGVWLDEPQARHDDHNL